jgi:hypothetical protein
MLPLKQKMTVSRKFFRYNSIKFVPTVRSFKELFLKILLPGGEVWSISWNSSGFYAIIWYLWNFKIALLTHLDSLLKNVALILSLSTLDLLCGTSKLLCSVSLDQIIQDFKGFIDRISCFFTEICSVDFVFLHSLLISLDQQFVAFTKIHYFRPCLYSR